MAVKLFKSVEAWEEFTLMMLVDWLSGAAWPRPQRQEGGGGEDQHTREGQKERMLHPHVEIGVEWSIAVAAGKSGGGMIDCSCREKEVGVEWSIAVVVAKMRRPAPHEVEGHFQWRKCGLVEKNNWHVALCVVAKATKNVSLQNSQDTGWKLSLIAKLQDLKIKTGQLIAC